jgi:hypothetical protein
MTVGGPNAVDNRPVLHYRGDLTGRIEGQVVGPTTAGEWLAVDETSYDPKTDMTTARFRYATTADMEAR